VTIHRDDVPLAQRAVRPGTADAVLELGDLMLVVDWKTGRHLHSDGALQTTALAHAEWRVLEHGTCEPAPHVDLCLVIHLSDEVYAVRLVEPTESRFARFKAGSIA